MHMRKIWGCFHFLHTHIRKNQKWKTRKKIKWHITITISYNEKHFLNVLFGMCYTKFLYYLRFASFRGYTNTIYIYTHRPSPKYLKYTQCVFMFFTYRKLLLFFFMHITRIMIFFSLGISYKSVFFYVCGKFINIVGNGMLRKCDYFYFLSMSQSILLFGIYISIADFCNTAIEN